MGEHTPTPWTVLGPVFKPGKANCTWIVCAQDVQISRHEIEANAEFIVRAANSHEELVAACDAALTFVIGHSESPRVRNLRTRLENALEKAGKA